MEKKISGKTIFTGKVLELQEDVVELENGVRAVREVIRHKGACCVLPITEKGEAVCVRQFRYPYLEELLEIPAGKLDAGESPEECARRELAEETGASCKSLVYLGKYYGSPAILDEVIHMYLARELTFGSQRLDEDEFLSVERIPLERLRDMVLAGEVPDGKTQAAVLRAYLMLRS